MPSRLEKLFQREVKDDIYNTMTEVTVIKTDPTDLQGMPDLLVLYQGRFAALEVKRNADASHRPNQDIYIERLRHKGFAEFIYPENKDKVLKNMYSYFGVDAR